MARRIIFTGGSGKACDIRKLDPKPLDCSGGNTLITSGTDTDQAFGAVSRRKCV